MIIQKNNEFMIEESKKLRRKRKIYKINLN